MGHENEPRIEHNILTATCHFSRYVGGHIDWQVSLTSLPAYMSAQLSKVMLSQMHLFVCGIERVKL